MPLKKTAPDKQISVCETPLPTKPTLRPSTAIGAGVATEILFEPSGSTPPPAVGTETEEEEKKKDPCKTLTGFAKGPGGIQEPKYTIVLRSVNLVSDEEEQTRQQVILDEFNQKMHQVRVPTEVKFRIDGPIKEHPLPAGNPSTKGKRITKYIEVVGILTGDNTTRDTAGHVVNAKFGGTALVGWLPGGDTNIVPINNLLNSSGYELADGEIKGNLVAGRQG